MRKKRSKLYGVFLVTLLCLTSISKQQSETLRGEAIALFSPYWSGLKYVKNYLGLGTGWTAYLKEGHQDSEIAQKLKLENQLLQAELSHLRELFQQERFLNIQLSHLKYVQDNLKSDLEHILSLQLEAVPAQVIFRPPSIWNNCLWINVGQQHNDQAEKPKIFKNSPVLVGNSVIGVVDYVGRSQSRVRLITDPGLNPSVRASRGQIQDKFYLENLEGLILYLQNNQQVLSEEELRVLHGTVCKLKQKFEDGRKTWRLAKGEICGTCFFENRGSSVLLKGTGFNYDFSDEHGPARDLRSGIALEDRSLPALPILKVNDLLITTGMDGIFPPGLEVARVAGIKNLQEGDYFYEIEATSTAGDLNQLSTVFIIPPYGQEEIEKRSI